MGDSDWIMESGTDRPRRDWTQMLFIGIWAAMAVGGAFYLMS